MGKWMGRGSPDGHRRAVTLAAAGPLFAIVFVLRALVDAPAEGIGFLYALPVGLVAVELGWRWGLGAAGLAFALFVAWGVLADAQLSVLGYATRALVLSPLGGVLGGVAAGGGRRGTSQSAGLPWPPTCSGPPASRAASRT